MRGAESLRRVSDAWREQCKVRAATKRHRQLESSAMIGPSKLTGVLWSRPGDFIQGRWRRDSSRRTSVPRTPGANRGFLILNLSPCFEGADSRAGGLEYRDTKDAGVLFPGIFIAFGVQGAPC
jgi:hypothetical protein